MHFVIKKDSQVLSFLFTWHEFDGTQRTLDRKYTLSVRRENRVRLNVCAATDESDCCAFS